jgi:hypothetical protein
MNKNVIFLAHEKKVMNSDEMVLETKVPIKGSVGAGRRCNARQKR